MREKVSYAIVVGFAVGVFGASLFPNTVDVWFVALLGIVFLIVGLRGRVSESGKRVCVIGVFSLLVACGVVRTDYYTLSLERSNNWREGERVEVVGVVAKEPIIGQSSLQLHVMSERGPILVLTDRYLPVSYGDEVRVSGTVERPESFETDLGRVFNYPGYLAARGLTHSIAFAEVSVLGTDGGNPVIAQLLTTKQAMLAAVEQFLPEPQAGLAEGLLLGVKRALGEELETVFRRTGIIHIVVLSGYNIMLVVAFVLYILSFVLPWRLRLVFGLLAIIGFALMVGLSATVVRASIMAAIALAARSLGKTYSVVRALFVAGFAMLLINPYLLVFDPGFQLSFLATLGLIVVAPWLETSLKRVPPLIGIREFLSATLATQLFVLPLLLYQIGEFSIVSVVVNVLVLPMVPVAMLATFVMVVLSLFSSSLAVVVSYLAYGALSYILTIPTFFAALPFAAVVIPAFPFYFVVVAYLLMAYMYWRGRSEPPDELEGWTIVTEESLLRQKPADTPIFFR